MWSSKSLQCTGGFSLVLVLCVLVVLSGAACNRGKETAKVKGPHPASDGPAITVNPNPHQTGNAAAGRDVYRFETFGNEGFWTDAARLAKGHDGR